MSRKSTGDDIDGLLEAMARRHSPKGPITTEMRDVPLAEIDKTVPVQFREGLNPQTLAGMRAVLGVGEEPEDDEQEGEEADPQRDGPLGRTPPVILVEAALRPGAEG